MMDLYVKKGNFKEFGAVREGDEVTFTYQVKGDDPGRILLFDKKNLKPLGSVDGISSNYSGRVSSVTVSGPDWDRVCYRIDRDGATTMDTYARQVIGRDQWADTKRLGRNYEVYAGIPDRSYDWKDGDFTRLPEEELLIYKLHMRGFTMQQHIDRKLRGTSEGFLLCLPALKELGVTALSFLPLYDFEEIEYVEQKQWNPSGRSQTKIETSGKINYWGYGPAQLFAPKASYFGPDPVKGCKDLVSALHENGMEIYMEVDVTAGLSEDLLLEALRTWVVEYHMDGFRLLGTQIPLERIAADPILGHSRIFCGDFPYELLEQKTSEKRFYKVDDAFLYTLRRLTNHKDGNMAELANQLKRQNSSYGFLNYAADTTGFTLYDSFSYGEKHNEDNGEDNRDGNNYNCSDNYGVEGKTSNRVILAERGTRARLSMAAVLLGQGIPMILSGDEVLNTQEGNNNTYCQDNAKGWVTFSKSKEAALMREFTRNMIAFRKAHPMLANPEPMHMNDYHHTGIPDLSYHGREPWIMWIGEEKRALGILYAGEYEKAEAGEDVFLCFNFHYNPEEFALPKMPGNHLWYYAGDNITGNVFLHGDKKPLEEQRTISVPGGSLMILIGKEPEDE